MDYFSEIIKHDPVNHYLVLLDDDLISLKASISADDLNQLQEKLQYLLNEPYYNVMMKPRGLVHNINRHCYVSLATYYHPNPNTRNGLPYIQKDGYYNPEGDSYDKDRLRKTAYICYYELLLYFLTNDKRYYDDAKKRISIFFLDKKTRMLPNMNHAQMIKGINDGRGIGIIDYSANFSYVLILLDSLSHLGLIEVDFYNQLKDWLKSFLNWLEYSDIALQERDAKNNHGIMYDFLKLILYRIFDYKNKIKQLVYSFIDLRLMNSFAEDGSMPLELARTKSKSYSLMAFKGIFDFAKLLTDFNLYDMSWYYRKVNFSLKKGFEFLITHLIIKNDWAYEQVVSFDYATVIPLLVEASRRFPEFKSVGLEGKEIIDDLIYILYKSL